MSHTDSGHLGNLMSFDELLSAVKGFQQVIILQKMNSKFRPLKRNLLKVTNRLKT